MAGKLKFESESATERQKRFLLSVDPQIAKKNDVDDSTKRFQYLLELSPLFRHFIDLNASKSKTFKKLIQDIDEKSSFQQISTKTKTNKRILSGRRRKTEKEEDAELLMEEEHISDESNQHTVFTESPSYIKDGKLREYQVQGLNWLISLYENRLSGILADEMGLGKTLQTISFLGYLRYVKHIDGPFIVIVPKSTLDNWRREFARWTPDVNVVVLQGNKDERNNIIQNQLMQAKFDTLITSFEMIIREKSSLKKFKWEYIVVDEAHRIKNEDSSLSQIIRLFYSRNRLLITGTPLQNNLHELWALLNFLLPDVFGDSDMFDQWFENNSSNDNDNKQDRNDVVQQLHQILNPFILRRVKSEVEKLLLPKIETNLYIKMSEMQKDWYRRLLEKDIDAVNGVVGKREGKTRLLNIVMQLRKCCNHPYLFDGAEPGPPYTTDEHLVFNAGKMIVLDKLLTKFKKEGSRVLIFSQMSRLLDILEDYCYLRDYQYCRIDGSTSHEDRISAIDEYNAPELEKFLFLLTTRAGGLGINLTSADIVILFDSDWNPQADLQAMDRAHRIGQKKQVYVYRFVTENAIEEKVLERAAQKLRLDQLVIQQGREEPTNNSIGNTKDDLIGMIQHGAKDVFDSKGDDNENDLLKEDIETILSKGIEKTRSLNSKFNNLGLDDIQKFTFEGSNYEWNGENFAKKDNNGLGISWINPSKRERREQNYTVDNYYRTAFRSSGMESNSNLGRPRAPKTYNVQDFQFFPPQLVDLLEREQLAYKKEIGYKYTLKEFGDSDDEFLTEEFQSEMSREERRDIAQKKIKDVKPLTEEELQLKEELLQQTFHSWTKRDFSAFTRASAKYGRESYDKIAKEIRTKTPEEVKNYLQRFWKDYKSIKGYEKFILQIEKTEKQVNRLSFQQEILNERMSRLSDPLNEFTIHYPPNNAKRLYSKLEDIFILYCVYKHGIFDVNLSEKIREEIANSDLFRFDWYLMSRTSAELGKRVTTLLSALSKEEDKKKRLTGRVNDSNSSTRPGSVEPFRHEPTPKWNSPNAMANDKRLHDYESVKTKKRKL